ncbi:hypothetical protein ACQPZJ_01680 [Actinoplanes sp. CA-054009]
MTHQDDIAALTDATTTAQLAAAIATFEDLRIGAAPGTAPGVPDDAEDGRYFNGFHLFTKAGGSLAATAVRDLPGRTTDLWADLDQEQQEQAEHDALTAEQKRGRGRPGKGDRVDARFQKWEIAMLNRDAKAAGIARADLIRALVAVGYRTIRQDAQAAGVDEAAIIRGLMNDAAPTR